jgi:hypothetical protein
MAKKTIRKTAATPDAKAAKPKSNVKKYTSAPRGSGISINEQDPKRRLGNFSGAGEHPRQGGRTSGIVGQTKKRNHTDRAKKK